jgi:RNA polymerase sigma-70 factor (ECF subfamily)
MLHCEARRGARRAPDGAFVPLAAQDPARWSAALTAEAEAHLRRAAELASPGRYALEAAVQSVHAERARTGRTNWRALVALYDVLAARAPTVGVLVARAAALGEAEGAAAGLAALDALPHEAVSSYQPFWAARAHLLASAGEAVAARTAYGRAMGLSEDAAVRDFLAARAAALEAGAKE